MNTALGNAPLGDGSSTLNTDVTVTAGQQTPAAVVADPAVVVTPAVAAVVAAGPAALAAAEAAVASATTPEAKAAAQTALDALKPPTPDAKAAEKAAAITTAEKTLADAKTPEEKAAATKALAELKDTPGVAPDKYEAFTLPEGIVADPAQVEKVNEMFKGLNLSQLQAQKLVDYTVARDVQNATAAAATQTKAYNELLESRLSTLKADPEIGGLKFDQTVTDARAFMNKFGTPGLQKYFNESDAGSHVELIRALAKAGKAISDDKLVLGSGSGKDVPLTTEYVMYPSMRKK